jgi:signal transduction histidine kinase
MKLSLVFLLLINLCLLFPRVGFAQDATKETSGERTKNAPSHSEKIDSLLKLARNLEYSDRENALELYKRALSFETDSLRNAELLDTIGLFNWQLGNYNEALKYFNEARVIFTEMQDSMWLGKIYNNIAVVHWGLGNSNEALNFYQTALTIRKAVGDKKGVAKVLNNTGMIYQDWGLYNEAFKWHNDALKIALEINDNDVIAYSYANIGICYENQNNFESALENYQTGFEYLLKTNKNNRSNSFFSSHIGEVYRKMNQLDSALFHFKDALNYANRINNQNRIAIAGYNLGEAYLVMNQLDSAKHHIGSSYRLSLDKSYTSLIRDNLYILSKIAEKEGNTDVAFDYFKQAAALKDSLFNSEKVAKFTDLQIKYYTEQQEKENVILRQNNKIQESAIKQQKAVTILLIAGSLFILGILIYIASSRRSVRKLNRRLEKSEKNLIKANADKDKFFTIIAHDLRSPFNGLLGITDLLSSDFDSYSSEEVKTMIQTLKESTNKVYHLLEGLLQWAQIQTGKINYRFEKIDLAKTAERVLQLHSANAQRKNISLGMHIQTNTFAIADEKTISVVFRNLVSNAVKFTNPGGSVTINAAEKKNTIEISVGDTGIGMEKSVTDKLFNINEKISEEGTAKESGTGLGLILCKEFVEKNHGTIRVESEPGKGSTFTFSLPKYLKK